MVRLIDSDSFKSLKTAIEQLAPVKDLNSHLEALYEIQRKIEGVIYNSTKEIIPEFQQKIGNLGATASELVQHTAQITMTFFQLMGEFALHDVSFWTPIQQN